MTTLPSTRRPSPVARRLPVPHLTEAKLLEIWEGWPQQDRDLYLYWLDLAKPHEAVELQAACFAVMQVGQMKLDRVLRRDRRRLEGRRRTSANPSSESGPTDPISRRRKNR